MTFGISIELVQIKSVLAFFAKRNYRVNIFSDLGYITIVRKRFLALRGIIVIINKIYNHLLQFTMKWRT
jgi:hypothetical protein